MSQKKKILITNHEKKIESIDQKFIFESTQINSNEQNQNYWFWKVAISLYKAYRAINWIGFYRIIGFTIEKRLKKLFDFVKRMIWPSLIVSYSYLKVKHSWITAIWIENNQFKGGTSNCKINFKHLQASSMGREKKGS